MAPPRVLDSGEAFCHTPRRMRHMTENAGDTGMGSEMARVSGKVTASGVRVGLGVVLALLVTGCGALSSAISASGTGASSAATPSATARSSAAATRAASAASASGPVAGPGPQATYRVQPQPAAGTCHYVVINAAAGDYLPDPHCTPGATNPRVTQKNLASTICKSGYTASIRPPENITSREKKASEVSYGFTGKASVTEYDHLISLEIGGDPNSPLNLWPEPNKASAAGINNPKDSVENKLKSLVCNAVHKKAYLPLARAQYLIATDWTTAIAKAQTELVS